MPATRPLLREILAGTVLVAGPPDGLLAAPVAGLGYDSRRVEPGFLFFAFPGAHADGRRFARQAMERGALAVVSESARPEGFTGAWIQVEHGRRALARMAGCFYGHATERLTLTGITGTNGKTTTAFLLDSMLAAAGLTSALVGTIEYRLAGERLAAVNTTPESLELYQLFDRLERRGGTHVTMEVSSHALALGRVHGMRFHTAVFTNLSRDHLDYHETMEEYFAAKRMLFAGQQTTPPRFAVLNRDDPYARRIEPAAGTETLWYGLSDQAALRGVDVSAGFDGIRMRVLWPEGGLEAASPLLGTMNVYNILAACGAGLALGLDAETIARGIAQCTAVPGRFERVDQGQPFLVVVDYAHTDDALRNAIAAARALAPRRVITLFGCGGDRDRAKRPLMGKAAGSASDFVVLTSDNPRSEDPLDIINDALVGLRRHDTAHAIEPDREKAIRRALVEAGPRDLVLIAGKGHETYQVLRDRTIGFDDREVVRRLLGEFGYSRRRG